MIDYPMCPGCRRADVEVSMAKDVRDSCPHCGTVLVESRRACCIPKCEKSVPVARDLPVCHDCGIKIAIAHMWDAERVEAVSAERNRRATEHKRALRMGDTSTACVYYVRLDAERIKIGFTSNLQARLSGLRVLEYDQLLAVEPGGRSVEKQRHEQFGAERIRSDREDFAPSERLDAWISDLRRENGLPRWATLPDTKRVTRRTA